MSLYLYPSAFYPIFIIIGSILIDISFGDPPTRLHPVGFQGWYISFLWKNRPVSRKRGLFIYGIFIVLSGLLISIILVLALQIIISLLFQQFIAVFLSSLVLKGSFSFRNLIKAGNLVTAALAEGNLSEARYLVSYHLVSRKVDTLDASAVASAAMESLSENFTDSTVSPFFWYSLGGPAASWCYRFINTADAMLGYRKGDKEWGGKAAARLDDILNWIPSRFSGWLIIAAAIPARLDVRSAFMVMRMDALKCSSPNSGWTMAAAAGALGVRFEKEHVYILNDGARRPVFNDLKKLNRLLRWSFFLSLPPLMFFSFLVLYLYRTYL